MYLVWTVVYLSTRLDTYAGYWGDAIFFLFIFARLPPAIDDASYAGFCILKSYAR